MKITPKDFRVKSSKIQYRGKKLIATLAGTRTVKLSADQIMALTRGA